ncbi:MAG: hypothetical protein AAF589_00980 [Planctomycetota bacterium]
MLRNLLAVLFLGTALFVAPTAYGATTGELVKREGWFGLLCCNDVPDCICKYCCPDYCKKPLPCPCGPLPPNLSCGCGPKKTWRRFGPKPPCTACPPACTDTLEHAPVACP